MSFELTLELALVLIAGGIVANFLSFCAVLRDWRSVGDGDRWHVNRVQAFENLLSEGITLIFQVTMFAIRTWAYFGWPAFEDDALRRDWLLDVRIVTAAQMLMATKSIFKMYLRRKKRLILDARDRVDLAGIVR